MNGKLGNERPALDDLISDIAQRMNDIGPDAPNYADLLSYYERLNALKTKSRRRPSPDVVVGVLGNLMGILTIVSYERVHVMTSKAVAFLKVK